MTARSGLVQAVGRLIRDSRTAIDERINALEARVYASLSDLQLREGPPGKDGCLREVMHWRPAVYLPDETVTHRGGVWQASRRTEDEPGTDDSGWRAVVNGLDTVEVRQFADDPRETITRLCASDGTVHEYGIYYPVPLHRGAYDPDTVYRTGDEVLCNGASWRARVDGPRHPPPSDDWQCTSMRGQRGRQGKPGDAGRDGTDGKDGKDGKDGINGRDGADGLPGPLGAKAWNFRVDLSDGQYVPGELYRRDDVTHYNFILWIALADTTEAPSDQSQNWAVLLRAPGPPSGGAGGAAALPDQVAVTVTGLGTDVAALHTAYNARPKVTPATSTSTVVFLHRGTDPYLYMGPRDQAATSAAQFVAMTGSGAGAQLEDVTLASLPANTWTDFPAPGTVTAYNEWEVYDGDNLVTNAFSYRRQAGQLQLFSLQARTNLTFQYTGT